MKNIIKVTVLALMAVSVSVSKTTPKDQPPPDCYPCSFESTLRDQPPPDCYPCSFESTLRDQPPPDCYPCSR